MVARRIGLVEPASVADEKVAPLTVSNDQELRIVFTGPRGAGKTTAITSISDIPPVSTEVNNSDRAACDRDSTTVALDYGHLVLEDGTAVRLYGTPGQERSSFTSKIPGNGAMGVVLLIDGSAPTALEDLRHYAQAFHSINPNQPFVIGVGRTNSEESGLLDRCAQWLAASGLIAPVFDVDVRKREDVLLLVETLLGILEAQLPGVAHAIR
jgi:signal recognition particle receptor subunit beta